MCSRVAKRSYHREGILMARASDCRRLSCPKGPRGYFRFFKVKKIQGKPFTNRLHTKYFSTFVRVFNFLSFLNVMNGVQGCLMPFAARYQIPCPHTSDYLIFMRQFFS